MLRNDKFALNISCPRILLITVLLLAIISPFDKAWTFWLAQHSIEGFTELFNRSIFEGDRAGVSDLGICVYIGAVLLLLFTFNKSQSVKYQKAYFIAGFLCYYGLFLGIGFVHPLKIIWGRKRPESLSGLNDGDFTQWYQGGITSFEKVNFAGSLPSGHTATCLMLLGLVYCLYFLKPSPNLRKKVLIGGAFSFLVCVGMGISRSMALKHWISDWVLSIGIGWLLLHFLFFHIWQMDTLLLDKTIGEELKRPKTSLLISMPFLLICLIIGLRLASGLVA